MESLDNKITNMRSFIYEHTKEICPYLHNTGIQNIEYAHGIILWSPCLFVTKQIARKYIDMITSCSSLYDACHPTRHIVTTDLHTRGTKFNIMYKITEHYIEFDMYHFCHTHNDKSICIDFIKDMTNKNNFENKRYIFLLHGLDVLTLKTVKSLQKIIENTADNAYYIFTCSPGQNMSGMHLLSSLCSFVRCPINNKDFFRLYVKSSSSPFTKKMSEKDIDLLSKRCKNDIFKGMLLCECTPTPELYKGHLICFLEKYIEQCIYPMKYDDKNSFIYFEKTTRDLIFKMTSACIPFTQVVHFFITTFQDKNIDIYALVKLGAECEHYLHISQKPFFVWEYFLFQVTKLIKNNPI